ncbi:MAG TPA: hypothetical protein VI300_20425, partial [Solirubrobacter sp.]
MPRLLLLSVLVAGLFAGCGGDAIPHHAAPSRGARAADATATVTPPPAAPRLRLVATRALPAPVQLPALVVDG